MSTPKSNTLQFLDRLDMHKKRTLCQQQSFRILLWKQLSAKYNTTRPTITHDEYHNHTDSSHRFSMCLPRVHRTYCLVENKSRIREQIIYKDATAKINRTICNMTKFKLYDPKTDKLKTVPNLYSRQARAIYKNYITELGWDPETFLPTDMTYKNNRFRHQTTVKTATKWLNSKCNTILCCVSSGPLHSTIA